MSNLTHPEGVSLLLDDTRGIVPLCQWNSFASAKSESSRVHTVPTSNFGCAFDCSNQCISMRRVLQILLNLSVVVGLLTWTNGVGLQPYAVFIF